MRMGSIAMADMVGLDLGIQAVQKAGSFKPDKVGAARLLTPIINLFRPLNDPLHTI